MVHVGSLWTGNVSFASMRESFWNMQAFLCSQTFHTARNNRTTSCCSSRVCFKNLFNAPVCETCIVLLAKVSLCIVLYRLVSCCCQTTSHDELANFFFSVASSFSLVTLYMFITAFRLRIGPWCVDHGPRSRTKASRLRLELSCNGLVVCFISHAWFLMAETANCELLSLSE